VAAVSAAAATRRAARGALVLAALAGCRPQPAQETTMSTPPAGAPAAAAEAGGWRPLVDTALTQWRGYRAQSVPAGWRVVDGVLTKDAPTGDLLSREQFGDFELELDWKLAAGGNAGLFYRATEAYDHVYWSAPEYQLLDDPGHPDGRDRRTAAGAAYGLYPAPEGAARPAGEWNHTRLVVRGAHVEHWLNGTRTAAYELGSPEWAGLVRASKFAAYSEYGRAPRGHLAIQGDHDGTLAIRALRVRPLTSTAQGGQP
jgi:hypothetical protein